MVSKQMLQEKLSVVVANTYVTVMLTQKLHWHVMGGNFYGIHKMTQHQYEEMLGAIDSTAEHMRALGYQVPSGMRQYQQLSTIEEGKDTLSTTDASLEHLLDAHQQIRIALNAGIRVAEELEDKATEEMLVDRLRAHNKHTWMIASSISTI